MKRVAFIAIWPVLIRYVLPFLVRFAVEILLRKFGPHLYPVLSGWRQTGHDWVVPEKLAELDELIELLRTSEAVHPAVAQAYRVKGASL